MTHPHSVLAFPAPKPRPGTDETRGDSPRDRLLRQGAATLRDAELLGLVLSVTGSLPGPLATDLLERSGGLGNLRRISERDLRSIGLEPSQRVRLSAVIEIARRLARARLDRSDLLDHPAVAARYLALRYLDSDQELMGALFFDDDQRVVAESEVFRGTLSRAAVEPRALLKRALLEEASALILWHTHPSGDPSPSAEDLAFTRRLASAAELLGIRLVDHIILGSAGQWVSLTKRGAW